MNDVTMLSATEQRALIAGGEVRPSELIAAQLRRIERLNARVNALVTLDERALERARALDAALDRGTDPGPLCGIAVAIKDVTPVAGLRHTYGSPLYRDHIAREDALVVERLRAAGAVVIGKSNTPEFATGGNTWNPVFGPTRNPWRLDRSAGGSTGGGAAALATGMSALAEGTDLGGSLRIPASFCGVVGLRPSPGLVPTYPSDFLWDTLQVSGLMARTAHDVALALQAVAGPAPAAPFSQPLAGRDFAAAVRTGTLAGRRLAYCPDVASIGVDPTVERVCRRVAFELRQAGAEVTEIELDLSWAKQAFLHLRGWWMVVQQYERLDRLDEMGDNLRGNVEAGLATSVRELAAAEHDRVRLRGELRSLLRRFDHLLTPAMAVPPFPVEENYPRTVAGREMATYVDWIAPTFVLSLAGLPIASVPCGLDDLGLPVGLQVVGAPFGEEAVLAAAGTIAAGFPVGPPPLVTREV